MTSNNDTRPLRAPSDSYLIGLARAALTGAGGDAAPSWPRLDLDDPEQREFGDYELLQELGRGGMGVVYRARQRSLDRDVAIKFIATGLADELAVARFLDEARAAARLMHPNIVPVHEVGSVGGVHYFSMPLVRGQSLAGRLELGPLSTEALVALMLKLTEAIDYAHRLGLLHLDLKPANVLLDDRNEPLIADFGLARHVDANGGVDAQEVSGTPSFMAPEQILIKQYRLTPSTDLYGLGAILYRCATGKAPHGEGSADELIRRAAAGRIVPPREIDPAIPPDVAAICMKCLELEPKDRYASASALADDLRRLRDGLPVSVRPIGAVERLRRFVQRERKYAMSLATALVAGFLGAVLSTVGFLWAERQRIHAESQTELARAAELRAAAERDRAKIAGEIGAFLFAYEGKERARDLVDWLRKRIPNDEDRQADALAAFAESVGGNGSGAMEQLIFKVIETQGGSYRRQMVDRLRAGSHPERYTFIALLMSKESETTEGLPAFAAALKAAVNARPDDPLVWSIAATYCSIDAGERRCLYPDAGRRLVQLDPDNMYHWLIKLILAADDTEARQALHEAASRSRLDDHIGPLTDAYFRAVATAGVPAPALLARPARVLAPNDPPESSIALLESWDLRMPNYDVLTRSCGARVDSKPVPETVRADCVAIGTRMMRSSSGLLTRMIGVALVRNLGVSTELADEAQQLRRHYNYVQSSLDRLTPTQRFAYSAERVHADMLTLGELGAMQRLLEFHGQPGESPVDWVPADPGILLTALERIRGSEGRNRAAEEMLDKGRTAEALASLVALDAENRRQFTGSDAWRLPHYLLRLGQARASLGQYRDAYANLQEAWGLCSGYGPGAQVTRDVAQAMVDLLSRWRRDEPDRSREATLELWRQRLADRDTAGKH